MITNPGPDNTPEQINEELERLRAQAANVMPDKHKEVDLLAKAYKDLESKFGGTSNCNGC